MSTSDNTVGPSRFQGPTWQNGLRAASQMRHTLRPAAASDCFSLPTHEDPLIGVSPDQRVFLAPDLRCPRQDSNLRTRLRRPGGSQTFLQVKAVSDEVLARVSHKWPTAR